MPLHTLGLPPPPDPDDDPPGLPPAPPPLFEPPLPELELEAALELEELEEMPLVVPPQPEASSAAIASNARERFRSMECAIAFAPRKIKAPGSSVCAKTQPRWSEFLRSGDAPGAAIGELFRCCVTKSICRSGAKPPSCTKVQLRDRRRGAGRSIFGSPQAPIKQSSLA